MTPEEAIQKLHAAAASLTRAGYVVTGVLTFCRPKDPTLVEPTALGVVGEVSSIRFDVRKRPGPGVGVSLAAPQGGPAGKAAAPTPLPAPKEPERPVFTTSGDVCWKCGSASMQKAGPCLVCRDCGETSGGCG